MTTRFAWVAATLLAVPATAFAQPVSGLYIGGSAGINLLQNEILEPFEGFGPSKRSYTFDPGPAATASVGYGFGNGLRAEIEGDYANNQVSGVKTFIPERAGGHEQQFGGFANLLYDFRLTMPVTPYIGLGAGYQEIELDGVNSSVPQAHLSSHSSESGGAFAYQAMAGVSYPIGLVPGLSMTAEYRLIGVLSPPPFNRGNGSGNILIRNGVRESPRATVNNVFDHEILVGLRYAFNVPAPPPPPAPVVAAPPAAQPARTYLVFFDWDRADLTARARQIIGEAAQNATHVQVTRIMVNGYTDLSGTVAYNQKLSVRRADAVAAELVRDGIPRNEITAQGFGESHPLVPTAQGVREPQNRRVEIIL